MSKFINKKDPKYKELKKYSNPEIVYKNLKNIYGKDIILMLSPKENKKYRIYDYFNNKWVDFGQMNPPMEDFTKHKNLDRRYKYLSRSLNIKGNWKSNPFSPNNLSIYGLWN
jgi:hypothetical protein